MKKIRRNDNARKHKYEKIKKNDNGTWKHDHEGQWNRQLQHSLTYILPTQLHVGHAVTLLSVFHNLPRPTDSKPA